MDRVSFFFLDVFLEHREGFACKNGPGLMVWISDLESQFTVGGREGGAHMEDVDFVVHSSKMMYHNGGIQARGFEFSRLFAGVAESRSASA